MIIKILITVHRTMFFWSLYYCRAYYIIITRLEGFRRKSLIVERGVVGDEKAILAIGLEIGKIIQKVKKFDRIQ